MHNGNNNENCFGYINYGEEDQMVSEFYFNFFNLIRSN